MNISLNTAHNVTMDYTPAGVLDRCIATLIDGIIVFSIVLLLIIPLSSFMNEEHLWIFLAIGTIALLYHLIMETTLNGKSIGKIAMNIQVVKLNGSKLTFWDCALRWIFRLIDIGFSGGAVAIILVIATRHAQRLGDLAANTIVIKHERSVTLFQLSQYDTSDEHQVVFHQATLLTDKDIQTIKDVLQEVQMKKAHFLLKPLAEKIKEATGIETTMLNMEFVQTVLKDYIHLTKQ